jgi:hypothetical protein
MVEYDFPLDVGFDCSAGKFTGLVIGSYQSLLVKFPRKIQNVNNQIITKTTNPEVNFTWLIKVVTMCPKICQEWWITPQISN